MPKRMDSEMRRAIERNAHKDLSAAEMHRQLGKAVARGRLSGQVPSVRAIQDVLAKARQRPAGELYAVTEVSWPESFGEETVPWEWGSCYFELCRQLDGRSPLLPLLTWFWRVTCAAPDAPADQRHAMAAALAMKECLPMLKHDQSQEAGAIPLYLYFHPWSDDESMRAYVDACVSNGIPKERIYHPPSIIGPGFPAGAAGDLVGYMVELMLGVFTLDGRDRFIAYLRNRDASGQGGGGRRGKAKS